MADIDRVQVFLQAVERGSFSAAARALGTTTSAVSRSIKQLESLLGAALLHRTTRQVQLTAVGRAYYVRAAEAMATLADAEAVVAETQTMPRGIVRL